MYRANHDTRRFEAYLRAMGAIVARGGSMTVGVDVKRVVGTRLHTRFAPYTAIGVKVNNTIGAFVQRLRWTNSDARRIRTMIAAVNEKIAPRIGKLTLLDVLDPRSIHSYGYIMFGLACHRAGVAADALALVDHEGVFRHELFLLSSSRASLPLLLV